jgi:hypothetical protein
MTRREAVPNVLRVVNPLVVYLVLVALAVLVGLIAMAFQRAPRRRCPSCTRMVAMSARHCGSCGYAFA